MESSESIYVSKFDVTNQELGFASSTSPDRDEGPPQSDPDSHTNLLHEHLLQSLDLKDTDENQNLHAQSESFDVKETADEAQGLGQKEVTLDEVLDNSQNVDLVETHHQTRETHEEGDKVGWDSEVDGDSDVVKNGESNKYPLRPDAEDCAYYMKTGTCKFGSTCKFNHPLTRRTSLAPKEKVMERGEEFTERPGQTECKYYQRTGGCKFGKTCRYNHPRGKIYVSPIPELNFLGLPIRHGEKECPYYMRTGSCKYAGNCRFNHPDPTSTVGSDLSGRGNGEHVSLKGAPPSTITSWTSPKSFEETPPFLPMMLQPTQVAPSQTPEWNGYQAPLYPPPERGMRLAPAYVMSPATETNVYIHHQQQILIGEFPERPGQLECSYYLKTGDCKFKSNCKYHHPKTQVIRSPPCPLSDKGLPLRPDQNICTHYSRYGICKFGPACKFDHPVHYQGSTMTGFDHPPLYGYTMGRSRSDITMQQQQQQQQHV